MNRKERKVLTSDQVIRKRKYDVLYRRNKKIAKITSIASESREIVKLHKCNKKYCYRQSISTCNLKFIGRLNECPRHPKKDYMYGLKYGNYDSLNINPSLIRRESTLFNLEHKIYGLFTSKNTIFLKGEVITTYPSDPYPSQHAIDFYTIYGGKNNTTVTGLLQPIDGMGMGSFINSPYHTSAKKNVYWILHKGIVYIKALQFIGYNTELLMPYGIHYKYNLMH